MATELTPIITYITLDLATTNNFDFVKAVQGDNETRYIYITLLNDSMPYEINCESIVLRGIKSDGTGVFNYCTLSENGEVIVELTEQLLAVSGIGKYEIALYGQAEVNEEVDALTTFPFRIVVDKANIDAEVITSTNEFKAITEIMGNAETLQKSLDTIQEAKEAALQSKEAAALSAENAATSANNASISETNAKESEQASKTSESNAASSANDASDSAAVAKKSETNAQESEQATKISEKNAKESEIKSKSSEDAAKVSENNSKTSETNAATSANTAVAYATQARNSATAAVESEENAAASETNAAMNATTAIQKANEASVSATNAASSATTATNKANTASQSADTAVQKAIEASNYATKAESYTHGGTDTRENEDIDNAKYYYQQSKSISESFAGALRPMGTVTFANLLALASAVEGDMYNISDQFTTTSSFKEGSGNIIPAGANIYKTADGYWDVLAGSPVTGVKGDAEDAYHRGNVNLTPANIGALSTTGDSKDNTTTFTTSATRSNIASGEKHSTIFGKIAKWLADLKTVAFTGSYSDLTNKPTIPAAVAVKGNAESSYRTGNVNLTAENIGALPKDGNAVSATKAIQDENGNVIADTYQTKTGNTANNTVTFTSGDSASPTAWTDVGVLASGEKHSSIFNKISTMFKNIRWLYKMLGTTDISSIGGGTLTGAVSAIHSSLQTTSSYFFGGRTYMSYVGEYLLSKEINLPSSFASKDVNNFFVVATLEQDNTKKTYVPFVSKDTGCFTVSVRDTEGAFSSGTVIWFNYIVVILH